MGAEQLSARHRPPRQRRRRGESPARAATGNALIASLVAASLAGCSADLPASDRIDKLRVLAVRAEPPEVAPGAPSRVDALVALPPQDDPAAAPAVTYLWLACQEPEGAASTVACGVSMGPLDGGIASVPSCAASAAASGCRIGEGPTVTYTPPDAALGGAPLAQVILTVIVADEVAGGAAQCALDAAANGGAPVQPDHCVIALKRLTLSRSATPNQNPTLAELTLDGGPLGNTPFALAPFGEQQGPPRALAVARTPGSAEVKHCPPGQPACADEGKYEPLYVSWFASAGDLADSRTSFQPADCNDACQRSDEPTTAGTHWSAPSTQAAQQTVHGGEIDFWAVVRDDRGGIGWRIGRARAPK